jgi:transglycosylase-like protein with SLT domain
VFARFWPRPDLPLTMVRMRSAFGLALFAAIGLLPLGARADIYRFIDRDGVEHYTNIQPNGRGWQRVLHTRDSGARAGSGAHRGGAVLPPDPERTRRYDAHIREAALLYLLPEEFIRAIMQVESNFYSEAVSSKGAMGLMQLMPGTASAMGVSDAFNPRQNVLGGARFLRVLANHFGGDLVRTIAAYNAGEAAVLKYGGVPPYAETRFYVQAVLSNYYRFRAAVLTKNALARR